MATTVIPFISRNINWLGIDSVVYPMDKRVKARNRLSDDLKPTALMIPPTCQCPIHQYPKTWLSITL
ncbi:hypothetical protein [Oceanobacillus rekensis]|uniref:hypothetical protein n=1 Tax=Oceanobacillus rekensis TaxID=937927 RepID=UPI0011236E0A|nr:hypothetical protein [Oceanobacillus rekensis]